MVLFLHHHPPEAPKYIDVALPVTQARLVARDSLLLVLGSSPNTTNITAGLPIATPTVSTSNNTDVNASTAPGRNIIHGNKSIISLQRRQLYGDRIVEINKGIPKIQFSYMGSDL
jgi:hypothetical protein